MVVICHWPPFSRKKMQILLISKRKWNVLCFSTQKNISLSYLHWITFVFLPKGLGVKPEFKQFSVVYKPWFDSHSVLWVYYGSNPSFYADMKEIWLIKPNNEWAKVLPSQTAHSPKRYCLSKLYSVPKQSSANTETVISIGQKLA